MKLDIAVNEVVLSNVGAKGEFKIRNSAKAFKILSDGLYSNKIKAIVRELSCNAVDSHVAAGKPTEPIVVHLPSLLEPWFSVADSGVGLNGDQVTNIYTTYFESTKTDSNDFIGALGLGSKSPFSYTENFTITAVKDGVKRIYSAFINESGIPCVAEMSEELTDDKNGVEVKFSVTNQSDYRSFRHEAFNVFMWFKVKPIITGTDSFTITEVELQEKDLMPCISTMKNSRDSIALMGNIAYPLSSIPEPEKHFGHCASLLKCGLLLTFEIGEFDFAASREELSYVPLTIRSIKAKLDLLNENLAEILAVKANVHTNEWDKAAFLTEQGRTQLYKAAVAKYVVDTSFLLYDPKSYHGVYNFDLKLEDLKKRELDISGLYSRYGRTSTKLSSTHVYVNNVSVPVFRIPVDNSIIFVLNDLKTGCTSRARYHFGKINSDKTIICVNHSSTDMAVRQAEYDLLIKELHNPPNVVKASTLSKPEKAVSATSMGITQLVVKSQNRGYRHYQPKEYTWATTSETFDENTTYYYVALRNHTPIDPNGVEFNMIHIKENMDNCGIKDISELKVYGIRKSKIKEIQDYDNFVHIGDKLKEETSKITDKQVASLVMAEIVDTAFGRMYNDKTIAQLLPKTSPYIKFTEMFGNVPSNDNNVHNLLALCGMYGKSLQVKDIKKRIQCSKDEVEKMYPLLKHCYSANKTDVVEYIKMVDKIHNPTSNAR